MTGIDPAKMAKLVTESRAEGTLSSYGASLRRVWQFGLQIDRLVFSWSEGELSAFLEKMAEQGLAEGSVKQGLAVVNMIFEAMGKVSPSKSVLVGHVKKALAKKASRGKMRPRTLMTLGHLVTLVKCLYKKPAGLVPPVEKRGLLLQVLMFLGMKRFSDIRSVRVEDIKFRASGAVEISLGKTKTDQEGRGSSFIVAGDSKRGIVAADVLRWYLYSLCLRGRDYVFPSMRGGSILKRKAVSYSAALSSLRCVCEKLNLPKLTMHSARIGACTAGAKAGVSREYLKACGSWSSSAVDGYVRLRDPGLVFNKAIFRNS